MVDPVFAQLPASARIRTALRALQDSYLSALSQAQDDTRRILLTAARNQAQTVLDNLDVFDARETHIFSTSHNLALLEDLTTALGQMSGPVRSQAQEAWIAQALNLRQAVEESAPALGINLARTDFGRVSFETVDVAARNAFSELSDFATLQQGTVVNLKTALADSMARGLDYREIRAQMKDTGVQALEAIPGFRRAFSVAERAEMIARTETVRIQTQLQLNLADEAGLDYGRSYINWLLTSHAQECLWAEAMGWVPLDELRLGPGLPPRHTNCILPGQWISSPRILASTSRWYDGPAIEITTERGYKLAVTENHPILTPCGWRAVGFMDVGCEIISGVRQEDVSASRVHPDNYQPPAMIEDIVDTFRKSGEMFSISMPTSTEDFHGDGFGGNVDVVWTNSFLRNSLNTMFRQPPAYSTFAGVVMRAIEFSADSSSAKLFKCSLRRFCSQMRSFDLIVSLLLGECFPYQQTSLRTISWFNTSSFQPYSDRRSRGFETGSERLFRFSGNVAVDDFLVRECDPQRLAAAGLPDRIASIHKFHYSGQVFNLQTLVGWFICNNITVHNCGCNLQTGMKDWILPQEGPAAMAKDFAERIAKDKIGLRPDLLEKLQPHVRAALEAKEA